MAHPVRLAAIAAAAAGLLAPQAASAAGIWTVERGPRGACMMTATYAAEGGEVALTFAYDPGGAALSFFAASRTFEGLPRQEGSTAPLLLLFEGTARYSEWESKQAPIRAIGGGSRAVIGEWGSAYSRELADTVTRATRLTVRYGTSDLGTYALDGVAEAFNELRRCSGAS